MVIIPKWIFSSPKITSPALFPKKQRSAHLPPSHIPMGYRLRVNIEITPFQKRPYIEVTLNDSNGDEVASTSIVEPLSWKLEFTMHIRGEELHNPYTLNAQTVLPDGPSKEPLTFSFDVEPPPPTPETDSN